MSMCIKCKKIISRDSLCKPCYEQQILKGQCLSIASALVNNNLDGEQGILSERIFKCARTIYDEATRQKFLEW